MYLTAFNKFQAYSMALFQGHIQLDRPETIVELLVNMLMRYISGMLEELLNLNLAKTRALRKAVYVLDKQFIGMVHMEL